MFKLFNLRILVVISTLLFTSCFSFAEAPTPEQVNFKNNIENKVDINQANVKALLTLKGVGKVKAQAIINYRNTKGKFQSIDDLLKIKGIGEKILSDNKSKIMI